ncbi:MAG: membrane protein insertase YidC [Clostridia bacterium]|nr:membrane protein insertase YidC [Clostridia bacterium]
MLDWLYRFLGSMLSFFESITGGYAFALLLYALVFKIVFLPFSIKQQKNQIAMAKLAPKIELIKAKYKGRNDQPTMQKQQQEIMELQQKEGYSPLSGCLPLLIQLPLIMLLYTVIQNPLSYIAKTNDAAVDKDMDTVILEVYKEVTLGDEAVEKLEKIEKGSEIKIINAIYRYVDDKIEGNEGVLSSLESLDTREERIAKIESFGLDYESIPNFNFLGVNLAETPSLKNISILCLIPVLAAGAQWVSMWLTRKFNGNNQLQSQPQDAQTKASMRMMDIIFPAMTLWMAFSFSGMLGLYWTFQALLGLLQSFILAKAMPLPKYTEEEIKSFHKAQKEAEKAQREAAKSQPKYRSLHYIDDDDYDVLPDAPVSEEKKSNNIKGDMPEIKD